MGRIKARGARKQVYFRRLSLNQRIQHVILMLSFSLLVLTGLPVRYPSSSASEFVINLLGGFTVRAALHRLGAVMLIGLVIYHVLYTALARRGRSELRALFPGREDFANLFRMLKYYLALAPSGPKFDRYNYIEKFEYFAVGWGSVIMILTGLMLWFKEEALRVLPMWALDIARAVHSYEALLAFLTIVIWHMYHVHLKPGRFPMDWSWLTGGISEREMIEEHPLEYERLAAGHDEADAGRVESRRSGS